MSAGLPYIDRHSRLSRGPCRPSRPMVVVSMEMPIRPSTPWKLCSALSFQHTSSTG